VALRVYVHRAEGQCLRKGGADVSRISNERQTGATIQALTKREECCGSEWK